MSKKQFKDATVIESPLECIAWFRVGRKRFPVYGSKKRPLFQARDCVEMVGLTRGQTEIVTKVPARDQFKVWALKHDKNGNPGRRITTVLSLGGFLSLCVEAMHLTPKTGALNKQADAVFKFLTEAIANGEFK